MSRDYTRVKRGMVFMYNIDPEVDKFNPPKVVGARGREYDDHLQYGWRTYVVVSNDVGNANSPTCNIVPMTTQLDRSHIPTHVTLNHHNMTLQILCEHVYTVNSMELIKYEYMLSDEVMDRVDEALAIQFNLKSKIDNSTTSMALDKIESIINGIIAQRVEELTSQKANEVDVEDAILRIGEGLENLLSKPLQSPTISAKDPEPEKVEAPEKPVRSSKTRRRWTLETMQGFLDDDSHHSPESMVKNYGFKDLAEYYSIKHYVKNKFSQAQKISMK